MKISRPARLGLLILATVLVAAGALWYRSARYLPLDGPATLYGAPSTLPVSAAEEVPSDGHAVSFFLIADTGWQNDAKRSVAEAMCELVPRARPDFVLMAGDNFYTRGVESVEDARWKTHFEEAYAEDCLDIPFYAALGNHDHKGNVQAQVEYTHLSTRWRMPSRYYTFSSVIGDGISVQIFVLDTTPIRLKEKPSAAQLRWFEAELARSTARWKLVAGHHPMVSNGVNGGSSTLRRRARHLLDRHGADLYLAGHDHDLQLLRTGSKWLQVVSGAGSSPRSTRWRTNTVYAAAEPGFVWILARANDLWIQFVTAEAGGSYIHRIRKPPQQ